MNTPDEAIAAEVRAALARRQISQSRVAETLGLSKSSVSQRLNAHRPFSVAQLVVIADMCDIPVEGFFRNVRADSRAA